MWKLRIGAFLTSSALMLGASAAAHAASGGNANAGDVWVDNVNVGQAPDPGHEMDPHLACQDISLWGSGLADSSGSFSIDGWKPSGSQEVDYSGNWTYGAGSGDQVIAVISVATLMSTAQANGDAAAAQGFHFKLDFSQDPQKHKTFWIGCSASSAGGGGDGGGNNGGGNNGGGGTAGDGGTPPGGSASTPPTTTTVINGTKTSLGGATAVRRSHRKHRHKRVHASRRHRARHVRAVKVRLPSFTG